MIIILNNKNLKEVKRQVLEIPYYSSKLRNQSKLSRNIKKNGYYTYNDQRVITILKLDLIWTGMEMKLI